MSLIQIIVVLAIICMIGGAGMILGTGTVQTPKKTKPINIVDATPISYEPLCIDSSTGIINMEPVKTKRIDYKL